MYKEKRKLGIVLLSIFVAIFVISLTMIGANKALAIDEDDGDEAEIIPEQFADMDDADEPNLDGSNSNGTPKPIWVIGHRANNRGNVDKAITQSEVHPKKDLRGCLWR